MESKATNITDHAEGMGTVASGSTSHAEGYATIAASRSQHVQGELNIEDSSNTYAHIVGNGHLNYISDTETEEIRSNAHTLDWDGNAEFAGDVVAYGCGGTNPVSLSELNTNLNKAYKGVQWAGSKDTNIVLEEGTAFLIVMIHNGEVNNNGLYIYYPVTSRMYTLVNAPNVTWSCNGSTIRFSCSAGTPYISYIKIA